MNKKKARTACLECGNNTARHGYTYCSNACQQKFQYHSYIERWKNGRELGLQKMGIVTTTIKKYLRIKYGDRCSECGWSKKNRRTGKVPLVADHVDGNWRNNTESNLRLICPNCDSLSETYAALNKGRGRKGRVISKRTEEARLMVDQIAFSKAASYDISW